jgi:hypothetical protein
VKILKDQIVILTTGEYSDYTIHVTAVALRDFETKDVATEYFKEYPEQKGQYKFEDDKFVHSLFTNQYLKELEATEWHFSNCNDYDDSSDGVEEE